MILNLTNHEATPAQREAGVINLPGDVAQVVLNLLTVGAKPSLETIKKRNKHLEDLKHRARSIAAIAAECMGQDDREDGEGFALYAMIEGTPFFKAILARALLDVGILTIEAFTLLNLNQGD